MSFEKFLVGGGCFSDYSVSFGPKTKSLELEKYVRQRRDLYQEHEHEKFPVVVGGCFCDYSFSSGPFETGIETSLRE